MSTQEKQAIAIGVLVGVAILVALYFFLIIPLKQNLDAMRQDIAKMEIEKQSLQNYLDDRAARDAEAARISKFERLLPEEKEVPALFDYLREIATDTGIEYIAIAQAETSSRDLIKIFPFEIELKAGYHQLGEFLERIEVNKKRFLRIDDIQLKINEENPTLHDATVVVAAFVYTGLPATDNGNANNNVVGGRR